MGYLYLFLDGVQVMTALAYGLVGAGDQSSTTTTAATPVDVRKRKFSDAGYRHRPPAGRYRLPSGRARVAVRRRDGFRDGFGDWSSADSSDSDDEDDEILEALFGRARTPTTGRRVRRPPASVGARRGYGRRRGGPGGDGDAERRRRWRPRGAVLRRPATRF